MEKDVDVSTLTDVKHQAALKNLVSTDVGRAFIAQFANEGDIIGGVKFENTGNRANDILSLNSASINMENRRGLTRTYFNENGGYGAITGGVIGGISGGLQYSKQMGTFRKGLSKLGVQSGEPVPATDNFLMQSQETWYPDAPMECASKFTVENVPANHQVVLDANDAAARTVPLKRGGMLTGNSNVYFNKNLAFTSAKRLFFTMGHEFVHVSQYASLAGQASSILTEGFGKFMEYHAYNYESTVLKSGNGGAFTPSQVHGFKQYALFNSQLHYNNFSWTRTVHFK